MTTIDDSHHYCTLINVFAVDPEKCQELFAALQHATETVMSKLPGYVSANLHVSDDQKTVTNYAQWATLADYQNVLKDPAAREHMQQAAALAISFSPVTYSKIWTHSTKG